MGVIEKFRPTIKKFSRDLRYEEAETDLIIVLIGLVKDTTFTNLKKKNDGAIVNYIYHALQNRKINLFKKYVKGIKEEASLNLDIVADQTSYSIEDKILIKDLLNTLPTSQRTVLGEKFINGYSDIEIANKYQISRQAVNKTKNSALKKLRKILNMQYNLTA